MGFNATVTRHDGDQEIRAAQNDLASREFAYRRAVEAEERAIENREEAEKRLAEVRARLATLTGALN